MPFVIFFAVVVLLGGAATLSQATEGVGLVGAACFLAIMARIVQASSYQRDLLAALKGDLPNRAAVAPRTEIATA